MSSCLSVAKLNTASDRYALNALSTPFTYTITSAAGLEESPCPQGPIYKSLSLSSNLKSLTTTLITLIITITIIIIIIIIIIKVITTMIIIIIVVVVVILITIITTISMAP